MSSKKYTKAEINLIVGRTLELFGVDKEKQLAKLLGEKPQSFSNKKNTGSAVSLIEKEAYKRNMDVNYILTGEGKEDKKHQYSKDVQPSRSTNGSLSSYIPIKNDLRMAEEILESDTSYAQALHYNIVSFHQAIKIEEACKELKNENKDLKSQVKTMWEHIRNLERHLSPSNNDNTSETET